MEPESNIKPAFSFPMDLLLVIIFSIIGAAMAFALPDGNLLRVIFGIPLLIFFPGYGLVSIIWPKKSLDNIERIALSVGLSIALTAILGLALNYSAGLSLTTIIIGLLVVIMILSGLAFFMRAKLPEEEAFEFNISKDQLVLPENNMEKSMVVVLAICLIVSGITLGYLLTRPASGEPFTELYVLDINGTTENYPVNLSTNEVGQVIVGINCNEYNYTEYEILFGLEGAGDTGLESSWELPQSMNSPILTRRNVTLDHGGIFQETCQFMFTVPGTYKIVWELEINGQDTDYEVHLWVEVHS